MKHFYSILLICLTSITIAQTDSISENLKAIKISESVWLHTENNNNGIVYFSNNEAIIVSTPNSDIETQNLINWVKKEKKAEIVGYVIDRWHPDAMEGLDIVLKNNINTYANNRTIEIAKRKKLPIAENGFDSTLSLKVGKQHIDCFYFGPSHTGDGIVVHIPEENILFGGNGIREKNGWVGNVWDANLNEWAKTTKRLKTKFDSLKTVIPGHGAFGNSTLIDYTIQLYDKPLNQTDTIDLNQNNFSLTDTISQILIQSSSKVEEDNNTIYKSGKVSLSKIDKELNITSTNDIVYNAKHNYLKIINGHLSISGNSSKAQFYFEELYLFVEQPVVEYGLVLKHIK